MPKKCDVRQSSPIYSARVTSKCHTQLSRLNQLFPMWQMNVSLTHRFNQNTEKCDATLTWLIGAFVPKPRQMKAPRTLREAESVFLLSSPNTVLKIYPSYISCPELTSETNTTKKAHTKKSNNVLIKHVQCNSTSHHHLNILFHKKTINISYKQRENGLIEWANRLWFLCFYFFWNQIQFVFLAFTGRKQKKIRWVRNRWGNVISDWLFPHSWQRLWAWPTNPKKKNQPLIIFKGIGRRKKNVLTVRFNRMIPLKLIKAFLCGASTYAQLMHPLDFILM